MNCRSFHDGESDGLIALKSLDLNAVHSFGDLVRAMGSTAFGGRNVGRALEVLQGMARDEECLRVLTVSGAMTVAKQGGIFASLIERGVIDAVVATGALMAHGLSESVGCAHYAVPEGVDDEKLFEMGYNRIYDTVEMESNLNYLAEIVSSVLSDHEPEDGAWSSARFCRALGKEFAKQDMGKGIVRSAWENNVPIFIPAFTDSELGLDVATWAMRKSLGNAQNNDAIFDVVPNYNPFLDLQEYARLVRNKKKLGIFTIGGGVPRNWAQQVAPYFDITSHRLDITLPEPRFHYGVRICPEPVHWGGLSGCTYTEGVSWGKFVPPSAGGQFAEVYADATVVLPLLVKALFEDLDRK
ncbi:MAG: deoxyhypusine synthase family protein [Candidatus Hydrogenedentes bacterium]|nr:deoxyhypusine synthase family protein [Candidatus Hydrogenedentota bacterium]